MANMYRDNYKDTQKIWQLTNQMLKRKTKGATEINALFYYCFLFLRLYIFCCIPTNKGANKEEKEERKGKTKRYQSHDGLDDNDGLPLS